MFIFGALLPPPSSRGSPPEVESHLVRWFDRISVRTSAEIGFNDGHFFAGFGKIQHANDEKWFISEKHTHRHGEIYVQAHGHPKGLATLSELAEKFVDFDKNINLIELKLNSINTEYLGIFYNLSNHTLHIVSDKIGIVPGYIYRDNNNTYYATALWVLKLLDDFNDELDWQGIAEKIYFRSHIDDRTMYKRVRRILGGTYFYSGKKIGFSVYYRLWDCYKSSSSKTVPSLLAHGFNTAVTERIIDKSAHQYATLSGGLDSRAVVASLAKNTNNITTFNFAGSDTLDAKLSAMYAEYIGIEHHHKPCFAMYYPNFSVLSRDFFDVFVDQKKQLAQTVWTGDDGSISIGFVYLRRDFLNIVNSLADGQFPEYLLNHSRNLPRRMFKNEPYDRLKKLAIEGVQTSLARFDNIDNAAKCYCFTMLNRVSRMFEQHYETAHIHRTFRCMPFLDVRTIEPVLSADMPDSSEHRLYLKFAREASESTLKVPWQAYPGHEQCTLTLPRGKPQWQSYGRLEENFIRKAHRNKMARVTFSGFWRGIVRKDILAAYLLRDLIGIEPTHGIANALCDILEEHNYRGSL